MTDNEMIQCAVDAGFASAAVIDTSEIVFDPSFRPYCEENLCGQYDANYSCPPACGSPEEMKQKILAHKKALVLQSIWEVDDYSDKPAIKHAKTTHNRKSIKLMQHFRENGRDGFVVGSGGCTLCSPCEIKNGNPCKYPDLRYSCMSAYCIFVKKLADVCGMEYTCGNGLLALFGMYVFD